MKQIVLFALFSVAFALPKGKAPAAACLKPTSKNQQPPPSIVAITAAASVVDPSFKNALLDINGIVASSPTFASVESTIESYAKSDLKVIESLEDCDEHPADARSHKALASEREHFSHLAKAVSALVSEEATHSSLADVQSALQSAMATCSTILTAGEVSFEFTHSSLANDEKGINDVTLADPRIVTEVEQVASAFLDSASLMSDLEKICSQARSNPTALDALTEASQWTNTDEWHAKDLKSIVTCYKTLYSVVYPIDKFLSKHEGDAEAFSSVVDELVEDPSIVSEVTNFVDQVSSSVDHAREAVDNVKKNEPHITSDLSYVKILEASNPSLSCKESALERDLHSKASTVVSIEKALEHPSAVKDPKQIASEESHYPSVDADFEDILKVDDKHPSMESVQNSLQEAEQCDSTIITDADELLSLSSPSLVGDVEDMDRVEEVSPTISSVLDSLSYVFKRSPSLSCAESVIAEYASVSPSVVSIISEDLSDPAKVKPSSVSSVAKLTAKYHDLVSALRSIDDAKTKFSSITSLEQKLTSVLSIDSSLIDAHKELTEYDSIVSSSVCSFVPSS